MMHVKMSKHMSEIQIPNGYYQLWLRYLSAQEKVPEQLGFSPAQLQQLQHVLTLPMDTQSSYQFFNDIIQHSIQFLDCPTLIFELARYIQPEHFGVLGYMASRSNSVAEAIQYMMRFSRLVVDGTAAVPMRLEQQSDALYLSWPLVDEKYSLVHEMTFACMTQLALQIFNFQHSPIREIHFAHAPRMAMLHYEKFYGCKVLFKQTEYQIVLNLESLSLKPQQADPSLIHLLTKQAEDAIALKPQLETVRQQVQEQVAYYLRYEQQVPNIEWVAQRLFRSGRTLQRQLKQEGTGFKQILEIERMQRCEHLLRQNVSLSDIAQLLGYSDQSALARAYKACTGQTLLKRKQQLQQAENDALSIQQAMP